MDWKKDWKAVGGLANVAVHWMLIALTTVAYTIVVLFGVVCLAAVQLRSAGGNAYDTWRLNYEANVVGNINLTARVNAVKAKAREDANFLNNQEICLRLYDENGLLKTNLLSEEALGDAKIARSKRTPAEQLSENGEVFCIVKGYAWLKNDVVWFKRNVEDDVAELADVNKALAANLEQYTDLVKGHQDFLAFKEMEKTPYFKPFVVTPYDVLVLLLVMLMGALGGIARLLRDYGAPKQPNPEAAEFIFIPLVGGAVAIGGYVLAKAGLLLLSTARGEGSLSPFMIGLVGIISGLLAREVIDTLADKGRKILGNNGKSATQGQVGGQAGIQGQGQTQGKDPGAGS